VFTLYAFVNYKTCGWCRKFKPVLESNVAAMNDRARAAVQVVDLSTPEGKETQTRLRFSGGIPALVALKDGQEVYRRAGYQDGPAFADTLYQLFTTAAA
jgi:thiol-disulfide isomerase/thioredoxin